MELDAVMATLKQKQDSLAAVEAKVCFFIYFLVDCALRQGWKKSESLKSDNGDDNVTKQ